jgi:hypothetical protein
MKYIDIKLSLPVVAPLLDIMKSASDSLHNSLASPLRIEDLDADFREAWTDELIQAQSSELQTLLGLFGGEFFSSGRVRIAEKDADAIVRAAAALRLQLRCGPMRKIPDEVLESGQLSPEELPDPQRMPFYCYVFLATLQELVMHYLEGRSESGEA